MWFYWEFFPVVLRSALWIHSHCILVPLKAIFGRSSETVDLWGKYWVFRIWHLENKSNSGRGITMSQGTNSQTIYFMQNMYNTLYNIHSMHYTMYFTGIIHVLYLIQEIINLSMHSPILQSASLGFFWKNTQFWQILKCFAETRCKLLCKNSSYLIALSKLGSSQTLFEIISF